MTTVANLRAEDRAQITYALFIEGLATCWTSDESGAIDGTDTIANGGTEDSWIGLSEKDLIDGGDTSEVVGQRTMARGLIVPQQIQFGVDEKTGELDGSPITFKILDLDDSLRTLFASEGKSFDILGEYIPASTTALGTSINVNHPNSTTNPRGKYIGLERIGPSGQRRFFPCFPGFTMPGPEHFWNTSLGAEPGLPQVSTDPIHFAGRRVALYRLYRDHHQDFTSATEAAKWPPWKDQHDGGGLVWFGTLEDAGFFEGNNIWSLRCAGPESLLKKQIGVETNMGWTKIATVLSLDTTQGQEEDKFGVYLATHHAKTVANSPVFVQTFDGWEIGQALTATDKPSLQDDIQTLLNSAAAGGGSTDISGSAGTLRVPTDPGGFNIAAGDIKMLADGTIQFQKDSSAGYHVAKIIMHEKCWKTLGYEFVTQHIDDLPASNVFQVQFRQLAAGEIEEGFSQPTPGPGYWVGRFTTIKVGGAETPIQNNDASLSNDAQWRSYKPFFPGSIDVLDHKGGQEVRFSDAQEGLYCQGNTLSAWDGVAIDGGTASNRAGLFAVRGKQKKDVDSDPEDVYQVALVEWHNAQFASNSTDDGAIDSTIDGFQGVRIVRFFDPRVFGFNYRQLEQDWAFTGGDEGNPVEIRPLSSLTYLQDSSLEYLDLLVPATLVSTGSATGYDGPSGGNNNPTFTKGSNDPGDATFFLYWGGDVLPASYGLAIPEELVADVADFRGAFPFGIGDPFNRGKILWFGKVQALDLLNSIAGPRRCGFSLHGRKLGLRTLTNFGGDADATILEADLSGTPGDPTTVIPKQKLRATGSIDRIKLTYRYSPEDDGPAGEQVERALDPNAKSRTGTIEHSVEDWGLMAPEWFTSDVELEAVTGVGNWRGDFKRLWAEDAANFYARKHFLVQGLPVDLVKGQDIYPGTRVRVTNPWVLAADGTMGVTQHAGIVLKVTHPTTDSRRHTCDILMFADGGGTGSNTMPHFAPVAKVKGWDSGNNLLYLYDDFREHGVTNLSDLTGFAEPGWSTAGGAAKVQVFYWDGSVNSDGSPSWALGPENTVSSVDTVANTITMTGAWSSWTPPGGSAITTLLRDFDYLLVHVGRDHADAPAWAENAYGYYVDDTFQTTGGTSMRVYLP